ASNAALVDPRTGGHPQSNAPGPLCVLRHCRKHPSLATGPSGRGTLPAQHTQQSELARVGLVEAIPTDQGAISISTTKAVSPLLGVASSRRAVKRRLRRRSAGKLHATFPGSRGAGNRPRPPGGHQVTAVPAAISFTLSSDPVGRCLDWFFASTSAI